MIVDIDELKNIESKIKANGNELTALLTAMIKKTEESKEFFDSMTGDEFRKQLIDYLCGRIDYIKNNYLTCSNTLNMIIEEYTKFYNSTSEAVGDIE